MRTQHALIAFVLAIAGVCAGPAAKGPRSAQAAVSIAYSLDELIGLSPQVVIAKAVSRRSTWEHVAGSRRIVTFTKLEVVDTVYGKPASKHIWVRTLGGAVGKIGQHVAGEARFASGARALLFLSQGVDKAWVVTGMAQGHFPLVASKKPTPASATEHLRASPSLGTVLRRHGPTISAQEQLIGQSLKASIATIRATKTRLDASKKK